MTIEKYYGVDQTTKIDSSNIDCELPGPTTGNPSLNSSHKIDDLSDLSRSYVKLADCSQTFTIRNHNDAIIDASLYVYKTTLLDNTIIYNYVLFDNMIILGTEKQVYIGYEDSQEIFIGKVTSVMASQDTLLDSDTTDCSAIAKYIQNDNTGMPIKYSLNKCTGDRTITFSYKNTPIFKIKQTYT